MEKTVRQDIVLAKNNVKPFISPTPVVQKKFAIGASNDAFEVEADAMADHVMGMNPLKLNAQHQSETLIQRKCKACEEETLRKKPIVQMKSNGKETGKASQALTDRIHSSSGRGTKMDAGTRNFMESRFGADFTGVNIHKGPDAIQMSNELNAQAFTVGNDIYFNEGKYNPMSSSGKHLLAHELTHTLQQRNGVQLKIQREMVQDRDGRLIYRTEEEAERRRDRIIRLTPDRSREGNFYLEWRWDPTNPASDPWTRGTRSRSRRDAQRRLDELARVEGEGNRWYVVKDTELRPEETEGSGDRTPEAPRETPERESRRICLTFDDGPQQGTQNVLNALDNFNIKGTFFLTGGNWGHGALLRAQTNLVARMIRDNHVIGNHTFDHSPATRSQYRAAYASLLDNNSSNDSSSEVSAFQREYRENRDHFRRTAQSTGFTGFEIARFPGDGRFFPQLVRRTNAMGMTHVGWNIEYSKNGDFGHIRHHNWQGIRGVACTQSSLPRNNSIALFHDRHWSGTHDTKFRALIRFLRRAGYTFGIISNSGDCVDT